MSVGSDLITLVRTELRSTTDGKPWTNTQLYSYLNEVVARLAEVASEIPGSGRVQHEEDITIAANTETSNLAATLAYTFAGLKSLHNKTSGGDYVPCERIPAGAEGQWLRTSLVDPNHTPGFFIRQLAPSGSTRLVNLHVRPLASGTRTLRVAYRFAQPTISTGTTLPFISKWDRLIALEVAKKALAADGTAEKTWDEELKGLYVAFLNDCSSQGGSDVPQGVVEVVAPYLFD